MSHLRRQITTHRRSEQYAAAISTAMEPATTTPGQWLNSDCIRDQALRTRLAGVFWVSTPPEDAVAVSSAFAVGESMVTAAGSL
jgi:hypothetical protein